MLALSRQNEDNLAAMIRQSDARLKALSRQFRQHEDRLTQFMNHLSETSRSNCPSLRTPFSSKHSSPRTSSTYSEAGVESTERYKMADRTCATPKESCHQSTAHTNRSACII